ncbi:Ig-like domain-containing protein [Hydrogenophaga sp. MI9]|uniref:Ig-like domain-containing protein n=1 Tax=Hydrogenophaga sp. MI9 TaxID=3453719 RepID=UPI003EEED0ED
MNKTYRSIWNASLGCYVAAPESAMAHSVGTSRTRSVRAGLPKQSGSAMVMETRIVFDGALLVTAIEQDSTVPVAEAPVADAPVADHPADTTVAPTATAVTEAPAVVTTASEPVVTTTDLKTDTPTTDSPVATPALAGTETTRDTAVTTSPTTTGAEETTAPLAVIEPAAASSHEIVFVDSRVPDISAFQGQGREVVVLTLEQDGLSQIADALAGRSDVDAIHIVSHGSDGVLTLGSTEVTTESIQSTQLAYLQSIGQSLTADGDILIYACDYAAGSTGLAAMDLLADITGADVAASTDATGSTSLGADWTLEQSTGAVDTAALAPENWNHALDFTFTPESTTGALGMANNIMGAGVTVVSATYQGGGSQSGTFSAGSGVTLGSNVLGFTSGTILSTGTSATGIAGPNSSGGFGSDAPGVDGDASLNALAGNATFDAAILDISFIPDLPPGATAGSAGRMTLEIVFGSEEYIEYVNQMNDVLEVTVNGQLVSLVPNASGGESTIGINSVNTTQNPSLFINNTGGTYNTQMDGFTVTIPMTFNVNLGQVNTIRLAVADAGDAVYDSWLLVRADSAQTVVVAEDDSVTTAANLPITVDLTANDYNLAGADLTLTQIQGQAVTQGQSITLGSGIHLTVGAGGQITVTGNGSSAVHDTFTYQVSNGLGGVASATVDVNITAPNYNPPVAHNDAEAMLANTTHSDSVLSNNGFGADTDPNGDALTVVQVNLTEFTPGTPIELPSGALLTMNANGSYVYNPNGQFTSLAAGATATDSFSYTITDSHGGNSSATVTFTITGVNDAPTAVADSYTVSETGATVLGNLTANDSDPDGDTLGIGFPSYTGSNGGSFGLDDSGNVVFIPGASFDNLAVGQTRTTSFSYTVSDGHGGSSSATVTVTVQGANDAPVAVGDALDVDEEGAAWLGNPLANDSDPDSSNLGMVLNGTTGSNGGSFGTDDSGNLIFVAGSAFDDLAVGQSRQTSITYTVSDAQGAQAIGTVTVTVHGANDAPVGASDAFSVYEDDAVQLGHITANDSDIDGGVVSTSTAVVQAGDNGGIFSFDGDGNLIFNPNGEFNSLGEGQSRSTSFQYTLSDGQGGSSVATVTVTVQGIDDAPVAGDDAFIADEDMPLALGSLQANDSDVDAGDSLSLSAVLGAGSAGGTLFADDSGALFFIAGSDFDDLQVGQSRDTSFTYAAYDSHGSSDTATVTITVQGVNDAPVTANDVFDADEEGAVLLGDLLANDSDPDTSTLTMTLDSDTGSSGGSFGTDDAGNLIFAAGSAFDNLAVGQTRETSITYTVSDGDGARAVGTVTITVHGVNDAPVGVNDDFSVYEDAAVMLGSVTANDSDVDGGVVMADTAAVHGGDNGGVFSFDDAGNLIFNPQGDFNGLGEGQSRNTSFQYTLGDGQGGSSLATVTITVQGINDAPVGGDDTFIADEDTPLALGSLLANDSDVDDGDTLSQSALLGAGSGGGTLFADDSGALYFIAGSDFDDLQVGQSRDTGFTYVVSDDHGGSAEAQVTVTVMGVNDAPVGVADAYDADANVATVLGNPADNDTDVEDDSLGVVPFVETAGSNGGLFGIDDSGRLVFNPAGDFDDLAEGQSCDTSFTYAVQDGNGGVSYAVATVTVHGVAVTPVEPTHPNEIVFVDSRVPDPQSFATGGREVVVLTLDQDGLVQMAAALSGRSGVAAVHIVSHGGDGYLTVGNANIDADSVQSYHLAALQTLATSLSADGDILIYACDFASSANAQNVLQLLAQYTSADVAASTDTTGDASLGGDWVLEATVGTVDASTLAPANWVHTLNVGKPDGVAVDKQVAQINLISHTDPETKMASAGGTAEPVRVQRMQALEAVLRNSVDQSVAVAAPVTPVAVETVAPQAEPAIRVATSTDADAADHPVAHSGPWALTDSSPIYSALDASDALDVGDGAGAALGLRAQLSRWSAGFGQRPLTRGALRA